VGYRKSLEGWSRTGIKYVEFTNTLLDEFLKTDDLPAARPVLTDLGLTAVHATSGVIGLWEPNPNRTASLESLKKRCEMFASMGLNLWGAPFCMKYACPGVASTGFAEPIDSSRFPETDKQVKPNIIVGMHAADRTRLELDARDANFGAVYLPYRSDAWVGTVNGTGRLSAGLQ
jgi:hypothetical protein